MQQLELLDIPSPCRQICETNSKGYCIGCFRNREERLRWNEFSNEQRRIVLKRCYTRKLKAIREKKAALEVENEQIPNQTSFFD
ncbi:MAG: DUF1289 domain-containing protein [Neisseriaceae bacterium]|nr:MAG: DUF1289 domain-containing protein [Neisseriaceae bacterium]